MARKKKARTSFTHTEYSGYGVHLSGKDKVKDRKLTKQEERKAKRGEIE